jgi:ATP-dependent exoDNAse (exonuclease V) alpha subunit
VLLAAEELASAQSHGIGKRQLAAVLSGSTMTEEQRRAFAHATTAGGLALIDGQAGTGKSFTLATVREAYEASGCRVIGLAPSNKVAKALQGDGFTHAATIHSEIFALNNGRRHWDAKTVVVVDEAAMIDTKIMAMLTAHASAAGAKLILAGDDRQLSSIDYGGMFAALIQKHGAASISQVQRQRKNDERRASEMMAEKNYSGALAIYDQKGAIRWTRTQPEARAALIDQWAKDSAAAPDKTRFVFAYTNADVATLNAALRAVRKAQGALGQDHELTTAHGRASFAAGDRIQFNGTDKKLGIDNGAAGTVQKIDGSRVTVKIDGKKGATITFDAGTFDKFSHGYAGTIYKGQGATVDQAYLYHSEHWKAAASYVAITRHREGVALFVARNTAKDLKTLARQMARSEDKRAASMFAQTQETAPARLLTPPELLATLAPDFAATAAETRAQTATAAPSPAAPILAAPQPVGILDNFTRTARAIASLLSGNAKAPPAATAADLARATAEQQAALAATLKEEAARIVQEEKDLRAALGLETPALEIEGGEQERTRTRRRKRGRSL